MRPCDVTKPGHYYYQLYDKSPWAIVFVRSWGNSLECQGVDMSSERGILIGPVPYPEQMTEILERIKSTDDIEKQVSSLSKEVAKLTTNPVKAMTSTDLLIVLKNEMLLATAKARGAREAYKLEAVYQADRFLRKNLKINHGDAVTMTYNGGESFNYRYENIHYNSAIDMLELHGTRILKSGKPSKAGTERICQWADLDKIKRTLPNK